MILYIKIKRYDIVCRFGTLNGFTDAKNVGSKFH